jgi:hypothetical protein
MIPADSVPGQLLISREVERGAGRSDANDLCASAVSPSVHLLRRT